MVEIERMYLLETNEKTWQFIAKSAFSSEEEQKQFETFMNEKLADAKENPEEYPSVTKNPENAENQEGGALHQNAALEDDVCLLYTSASAFPLQLRHKNRDIPSYFYI